MVRRAEMCAGTSQTGRADLLYPLVVCPVCGYLVSTLEGGRIRPHKRAELMAARHFLLPTTPEEAEQHRAMLAAEEG